MFGGRDIGSAQGVRSRVKPGMTSMISVDFASPKERPTQLLLD